MFHAENNLIFQHMLVTYSYQSVITFGGCRDDFMVVVSQQREPGVGKKSVEKLVFAMAKPKVGLLCTVHLDKCSVRLICEPSQTSKPESSFSLQLDSSEGG